MGEINNSFTDVILAGLLKKLPPRQEVDHCIELVEGERPPTMALYCKELSELEELWKQLKKFLDAGYVRLSKSPFDASILFQYKHNGLLRMCVDYMVFSKMTMKNKYLIPMISYIY